ncbi:hypothetical protein [Rubrobacter marinus]|nr:hypothetical protein [Rubrobacter marinus]
MCRAGEGLYRDGGLVGDAVGDRVELRGMGDERPGRPAPPVEPQKPV